MKHRRSLLATTALFLLSLLVLPSGARAQNPPAISARAAILVDAATGRVLYEKNADQARPVASTQKLLTALIIAEGGGLDNRVTVAASDTKVEPTVLGFKAGEKYIRGTLLQVMIVKSCNDVARCLARDYAGSEQSFAALMTRKAQKLGATNSRFLNANGLPLSGQYSTARDMSKVARAAWANPTLRPMMRTREMGFRYANGKTTTFETTNKLMRSCGYVTGMKTGYTNAAGKCLVASAEYNGRAVISVMLGCPTGNTVWNDSKMLIDWALTRR